MYHYVISKVADKSVLFALKIIWDKISSLRLLHNKDLSSYRSLRVIEKNYYKIKLIEEKSGFYTHSNASSEQFSLRFVDPGEIIGNLVLSSVNASVET